MSNGREAGEHAVASSVAELPGGRVFGYREYGDPDGRPVIALHGTPGSRFKFASAHASAAALGLRVISLDRWGYGLSSARPGGRLGDFAADIADFADRLGLGRFRVVGISGGAPFAVAIAARVPERVVALALVSPLGPIAGVIPRPRLSLFHALCFRVLPFLPGAVPAVFNAFRLALRVVPGKAIELANSRSEVDRQAVRDGGLRDRLARTFSEGLEPGVAGPCSDMAIFARPWGIDLSRADMPSRLWIGTADLNVPIDAARALADRLPRCELVEIAGAGHLWITNGTAEVMAWLARHG